MVNVMVTGATGLLGRAVVRELQANPNNQVIACGFSRAHVDMHKLDLTQSASVKVFVETHRPDIIVHCAAERRPDVSEQNPAAALALNAEATQSLADAASQSGAWLLYISTDYVFDGTAPPYIEDALTHPVNFYGDSKRQGEMIITDAKQDFAMLRLPILYGEVETVQESAVMVLLNNLLDATEQYIDDWAVRSPTSTADVATAIAQMVVLKASGATLAGNYHFSASDTMSKYQMLLIMGELLGLGTQHLNPVMSPTDSVNRPHNCTLSCERLASLSIQTKVPFKVGIGQALQQSPSAMAMLKQAG
ncbi:NAD(P)-dependent oxidoreductase [Shewanella sp. Choline-02u-19]|jgi:S-adenosylmethionine synthetase|uniref:dTDP-4-dehydrorhamnose reductase family protein n=1 Tax=unclassified Shewanella TaxID=196818 RepID=UPI000C3215A7|nr:MULTISPECIES: SDR family oxidoreductase [unclassified Shewanella]PKG56883.1 NAD(P)-dependent oxidoreductase [Shewanella sp. GutDb-MelDb]PKG74420.1 NAD(P)-dependent oxidoreductase [Shewanella sp. GutCb]PKH57754.1 NAD(P)-dependent oxidoreductase [Shewanella sp. Bg11-22]PKI29827.1 NAD(P)-dependent oxidoreductase [Shewanella sp. Choline-02u-19]